MQYRNSAELTERRIEMPDPSSVHVAEDVDLDRIGDGVVLYPGSRIEGPRTLLSPGSRVGTLGPAVLRDVAMGRGASIASGSAEQCVLMDGAGLGPCSHVRGGTLLEEQASTGHSVGLKQSLLLAFATVGSNVNFCDCLLTGGRSRQDHSEVGSGFIHFNFTPHGMWGDKATPSLFGTVPRGVTLREDRIFLGGAGGVVGPVEIGFGTCLAAGAVYRRDHGSGELVVGERLEPRVMTFDARLARRLRARLKRSARYVGQLRALQSFHRHVRRPRARDEFDAGVIDAAVDVLEVACAERWKQIDRLIDGARVGLDSVRRSGAAADRAIEAVEEELTGLEPDMATWRTRFAAAPVAPLPDAIADHLGEPGSHPEFVASWSDDVCAAVTDWLDAIVAGV